MLHFKKLRWKNLLSTGNYWIELDFTAHQNTLIVGENGSGKSTMLDALCYVLYNCPFRNINKTALPNSINQKETVVEVEFETENHKFKIIRGIKPNIFEIYRDGKLINQDADTKDYQDYLEHYILKLNYKSFTQIVILGAASFTPFMQLPAADRRSVIEDLLDIQIFSIMNGIVKGRLTDLQNKRGENKVMIEGAHEKIAMQTRYMQEAQQGAEKLIQEYKDEIDIHAKELQSVETMISTLTAVIDGLKERIKDKKKLEQTIKKATQFEAQIEQNLSKFKQTKNFFETNHTCPTCAQTIDETFKGQQLSTLTTKVTECADGLDQLNTKLLEYNARKTEIEKIEREISSQESMVNVHRETITQLKKFMQNLEEKIAAVRGKHDTVEREQERLEDHKKELNTLEDSKKTILEQIAYYETAGTLLKDTGIKTKIVRQYLPIINTMVNKYLAAMDFFVNFNLDESFKETIKSRYRDEFSYASFSEGEKQRIDMALMLTWRTIAKMKNSANTNILILDEIFDSSMDTNGADELMKILRHLDDANVFVISHRGDVLQDKFGHVIKFAKQQNFSQIVS
jgi:DNA repair exonuclease SbcCD ATPase subunit